MASLREQGIQPIDLVVSNLYPFRSVAGAAGGARRTRCSRTSTSAGPSMVRAAAKNHVAVAVVTEPERYGFVLDELRSRDGELSAETRRDLAAEAFAHTAVVRRGHRGLVHRHRAVPGAAHARPASRSPTWPTARTRTSALRFYRDAGARRNLLSRVEQHGGPQLSFNNLGDLQAARMHRCRLPGAGSGHHQARDPLRAWRSARRLRKPSTRALACDPAAAFGGVIAVNRPVSADLAAAMTERKLDVLFAPGYEDGALDVLQRKDEPSHPRGPGTAQGLAGRTRRAPGAGRAADAGSRHRA